MYRGRAAISTHNAAMKLLAGRFVVRESIRYFLNNPPGARTFRNFSPGLISRCLEFGYVHWPKALQPLVRRADVLDLGCGMGLHAVGFVLSGVRNYTGCDPIVDLDSDRMKNGRRQCRESSGWTPRQISAQFPHVRFVRGGLEGLDPEARFDVAVLHNTTEHLRDVRQTFRLLHQHLRAGGRLIFNHHNFYAWNGHHMRPKSVPAIDPADPAQRRVVDWAHLDPDAALVEHFASRVNRIALDELQAITGEFYNIETWRERLSNATEGVQRLTPEVLKQHPRFTRRDLATQSVYCVARRRDLADVT